MRKVRIINGIYGYKPAGSKYITPVQAGDPPILVEVDKAASLVARGIAVFVYDEHIKEPEREVATGNEALKEDKPVDTPTEDETPLNGEIEAYERPEYNTNMKAAELREIMDDCGISFRVGMSKADMVGALDEYFEDETEDSGEEMPNLLAEEPVL